MDAHYPGISDDDLTHRRDPARGTGSNRPGGAKTEDMVDCGGCSKECPTDGEARRRRRRVDAARAGPRSLAVDPTERGDCDGHDRRAAPIDGAHRARPDRGIAVRPVGGRASYPGSRAARLGRTADGPKTRLCRAALHLRRSRPCRRRAGGSRADGGLSRLGARGAAGRCGRSRVAKLVPPFSLGRLALRAERLGLAFARSWNEELVLERYELLYEAGLIQESWRDLGRPALPGDGLLFGVPMAADHRRVLATAIGRLRGKIKYRPVVFELMPPAFTLLQLQRTVEALSGVRLHKQNFRRLVEHQGLVEETGRIRAETGGRPARLVRFRREVLLERPAPGLRLRAARRVTVS